MSLWMSGFDDMFAGIGREQKSAKTSTGHSFPCSTGSMSEGCGIRADFSAKLGERSQVGNYVGKQLLASPVLGSESGSPSSRVASSRPSTRWAHVSRGGASSVANFRRRLRRGLDRLQSGLAKLPRDIRKSALQNLSNTVRLALIDYMEREKERASKRAATVSSNARPKSCYPAPRDLPSSTAPRGRRREGNQHLAAGISKKRGGYVAQVTLVSHLHAVTRCLPTIDLARRFHCVLARAKDLLLKGDLLKSACTETDRNDQACHVRDAIKLACTERRVEPRDLGLSFRANVDAHAFVGRALSTSYGICLDEALSQRSRLLAARSLGWDELRAAWMEVMQTQVTTRSSRIWGRAKPKARSQKEAEAIADSAWHQHTAERVRSEARVHDLMMQRIARTGRHVEVLLQLRHRVGPTTMLAEDRLDGPDVLANGRRKRKTCR